MEVCLNGKSVRMGFIVRLKSTGKAVGDVGVIIPITKMDDDYAWWEYGVLAYLHHRKYPTNMDERNRYSVECKLDYQTRHAILDRVLAERTAEKELAAAEKLRMREAKKEATARKKAAKKAEKKGAKAAEKLRFEPVAIQLMAPISGPGTCPRCGYHDPNLMSGVACPNCGN